MKLEDDIFDPCDNPPEIQWGYFEWKQPDGNVKAVLYNFEDDEVVEDWTHMLGG